MKVFELYWSWYEDHSYWLFTHPDKTKEQFEADVKMLLQKYGDAYLKSEHSWTSAYEWIRFVAEKLPELGYTKIEQTKFGFFGGYILDKKDKDWEALIGKELMEKAFLQNERVAKGVGLDLESI